MALLEGKLRFDDKKEQLEKNPQILKELSDELFFPLIREFIKVCAKFDRFYLSKKILSINVRQIFDPTEIEVLISKLKNILTKELDLSVFRIEYYHDDFFNPKFPNFSHNTSIAIEFRTYSYLIKIRDNTTYKETGFEKSYSEIVLPNKLYSALDEIAKSHKNFIQGKTKSN